MSPPWIPDTTAPRSRSSDVDGTRGRITVGYDGSPDATLALHWAVDRARARGLSLDVVIVVTDLAPLVGDLRQVENEAAGWSERAAEVLTAHPDVAGEVTILHGAVVPVLLDSAKTAEMLLVGSRGHGLLVGSMTGSVSQHLARHAACPVVVVRRPHREDSSLIVVGLDGSAESERALRFACDLVTEPGQSVLAVHGYHATTPAKGNLDDLYTSEVALRIKDAEQRLHDWVAPITAERPDIEIDTEAIAVSPVRALIDCSAVASLVVVGSRGRDAFAELLLGSVSQGVLHDAHCPVAVVR